jgi:large subunit ribosomal protein L10
MARAEKEKTVEELAEMLKKAQAVVLSDFTGLNVEQMAELRRRCRESQVVYRVVKNTLARFAASKADLEPLIPYLTGPNGFTFGYDDPAAPARVINGFAKDSKKLTIKGGIYQGEIIGPDQVKRIATLPGKDVLLSQLLMQMNAPISSFAEVLRSMLRQFLHVLTQIGQLGDTEQSEGKAEAEEKQEEEKSEESKQEKEQP